MTRALPVLGCLVLLAAVVVAQQPLLQNGKIEPRRVSSLERDVAAIGGATTVDPVWIAWRVPMIDGDRESCSSWNHVRGDYLEGGWSGTVYSDSGAPAVSESGAAMKPLAPPSGPMPLEGGSAILVLLRYVDGKLERVRSLRADCPIDAGGRTLHWLENVSVADSLRFLDTLTRVDGPDSIKSLSTRRTMAGRALEAIALHKDPGADAILERIASDRSETTLRNRTVQLLATHRGARGLSVLQKQLAAETNADARRQLVTAIGSSSEPGAVAALRPLLKDPDAKVRAAAVSRYAQTGGPGVLSEILGIIETDTVDSVKSSAVSSLTHWPRGEGIPHLVTLARSTKDPVVRKQAVSALSNSRDPRAIAYMEELLRR